MNDIKDNTIQPFTYYCNTKEESNNAFIPDLIRLRNLLEKVFEKGLIKSGVFAVSFGKRLLISKEIIPQDPLKRADFCEIIDLDPVKKTIIYFGAIQPPMITSYLWMIHYAKKEIQCSLYLNVEKEKTFQNIPGCKPFINKQLSFIEEIKIIMKHLQKTNELFITNNELILTADSLQSMKNKINKI